MPNFLATDIAHNKLIMFCLPTKSASIFIDLPVLKQALKQTVFLSILMSSAQISSLLERLYLILAISLLNPFLTSSESQFKTANPSLGK